MTRQNAMAPEPVEQINRQSNIRFTTVLVLFIALVLAFSVQSAHYIEHIAQMYQIYALGMKPPTAHGLLGSVFDFEWVHFLYNLGLEVVLIRLWVGYRSLARSNPSKEMARGTWILGALVLFQGYHSIEHIVKMSQFLFNPIYQSGLVPTPGILPALGGIPIFQLHFWLNTFVWGMLLIALWYVRPRAVRIDPKATPVPGS